MPKEKKRKELSYAQDEALRRTVNSVFLHHANLAAKEVARRMRLLKGKGNKALDITWMHVWVDISHNIICDGTRMGGTNMEGRWKISKKGRLRKG